MNKLYILVLISGSVLLKGCGGDDPRSVVKGFVNAVLADDSSTIEMLVDWDTMIKERLQEMSPEDSADALIHHKQQFFSSLVDSGSRRLYYQKSQIVINKSVKSGDRAEVELSFIDRDTCVQNYTKVVLIRNPDGWKLIYFY